MRRAELCLKARASRRFEVLEIVAIREHPATGTILICDFNQGFREPEMVKVRPVIVVSPKIGIRAKLCTVVALSTTPPRPVMPYHCKLDLHPTLPVPWADGENWVKGDMINSVGFHRLNLVRTGKDRGGRRLYRFETLTATQMKDVRTCILRAMGMTPLTKHL